MPQKPKNKCPKKTPEKHSKNAPRQKSGGGGRFKGFLAEWNLAQYTTHTQHTQQFIF